MKISEVGVKLIKYFEGLHDGDLTKIGLQPKQCPAGIWTIGYGHAMKDKSGNWLIGDGGYNYLVKNYPELVDITEKEAEEILKKDIQYFEKRTLLKLKPGIKLKQHEFDALVSHTFNTGGSNTLFRMINMSSDIDKIMSFWCTKYISANGKVLKGLKRRRKVEWELFLTGKLSLNAKV